MRNTVHHGDCLEVMKKIESGSVDMILADLPYGTTACKWDTIIPFKPLWEQYERIAKPNAAIVLTASQPFTSALVMSNATNFKYCWIWSKDSVSNPQLAKIQPLKSHEEIAIFSYGRHNYFPQDLEKYSRKRRADKSSLGHCKRKAYEQTETGYPKSIINIIVERGLHPTQKPVELFQYLIKTYTRPNDLILDNCAGSGTTAIAAINTGRDFILIEKEEDYFNMIQNRIREHRGIFV